MSKLLESDHFADSLRKPLVKLYNRFRSDMFFNLTNSAFKELICQLLIKADEIDERHEKLLKEAVRESVRKARNEFETIPAEGRICFVCKSELSNRTRPTIYNAAKNSRLGAPEHLYLCADCAKKNALTLNSLMKENNQIGNDNV